MAVDINSIRTILSVNGLSSTSTEQEIRDMLTKANYTSDEVSAALLLLKQPAPARKTDINVSEVLSGTPPGKPITIPPERQTSSYPGNLGMTASKPPASGGAGVLLFILLLLSLGAAYLLGTLYYPAVYFKERVLCLGIFSPTERATCLEAVPPTP